MQRGFKSSHILYAHMHIHTDRNLPIKSASSVGLPGCWVTRHGCLATLSACEAASEGITAHSLRRYQCVWVGRDRQRERKRGTPRSILAEDQTRKLRSCVAMNTKQAEDLNMSVCKYQPEENLRLAESKDASFYTGATICSSLITDMELHTRVEVIKKNISC